MHPVVQLHPATAADTRLAYEEIKDIGITDLGRGEPYKWAYRILKEPSLTEELARLSLPYTHRDVDSITFQPCRSYEARTQDRHDIQTWTNAGGSWTFTGIFDGHMNHETVDYTVRKLPESLRQSLEALCRTRPTFSPDAISELLSMTMASVDQTLMSDFRNLFPGGDRFLKHASPEQLKQAINDVDDGGTFYTTIARMLGGTTALITLFHQNTDNLWVANLGDCCAVLGRRDAKSWKATTINTLHNGSNAAELQRIRSEHHGESECILNGRVLGWLAPTRAIGDGWLKFPAIYTEKVFSKVEAPWMTAHSLEKYVPLIKTPPYVSGKPEVYHRKIRRDRRHGSNAGEAFLITCSDGLLDLTADTFDRTVERRVNRWVNIVGEELDKELLERRQRTNLALKLLRDAIGGDDLHLASRTLTVEMEEKWIDDTTIIVQRFI
ncbi:protein serine/threonine phosphatase 2C [Trametopsis cervina]|nr:protein serine/threonine phosphatase 2C [Trametopsis cervina]